MLRSEDLASAGAHDAAFLAAFRKRMAQEPVVLAPAPTPQVAASLAANALPRRSWATPFAVAAGFVAVAGVLVITQMTGGLSGEGSPDGLLAGTSAAPARVVAAAPASAAPVEASPMELNGQLIRDVRLDEYLAAHKKFGGSSVPGGPSGFLRNAAADGTAR